MLSVRAVAAFGAAAIVVSLSACSGSSAGPSPTGHGSTGSSQKFVNGATFTAATNSDPGSLDPYANNSWFGNWTYPAALAYDSLVSFDAEGNTFPLLAAKWDATTTTASFTLREGITCSDGSPLKASDVATDINFVADAANKSVLTGQFVKAGSKATSDDAARTIDVTSSASDPFLLQNLGSLPIVCKKGMEDRKSLVQGTDGTGLFKVTNVVPGSQYTLVRRRDYAWGPGDWKNNQPGLPDKIVLRIIANATTEANLLLAGEINWGVALSQRDAPRLKSLFKVTQLLPTGVFLFNEAPGHPTQDPAVRRALVQALNLPEVGKVVGEGAGQPTRQIDEYFLPNVCPGDTVAGNIPGEDVEAAKSGLQQAGWIPGSDGIRMKGGKRLTLTMPLYAGFAPFSAAAELMTKKLAAVGMKLVAKGADGPAYAEAQTSGRFDLVMQSWSFPSPSQMVGSYKGNPPGKGGNNVGDVQNEEYNQLAEQAATKAGKDGCPLWNQAESALIKALDVVPFWSTPSIQYGHGAMFSLPQFTWSIRMTAS